MKKIISLIMIAILTIFMVGCSNKKQTFYKNQLNIVSDSNDVYVIALTNRDEISHYSMYKLKEYDEYEKLYDLPVSSNQAIENHHILWDNDKFYLIYYNIIGYNADTGEELYRAKDKITPTDDDEICNTSTNIRRIYGKDNKYIYYNYYCVNNQKEYYARITPDLKNIEKIEKSDIPSNLIN